MLKIRRVKTGSGKIAVQVVLRVGRITNVVKHIGSGGNDTQIGNLVKIARTFINKQEKTKPLFPEFFTGEKFNLVSIDHLKIIGHRHNFAYEFLERYYRLNGFEKLNSGLLKNLSIIRIAKPASKLKSIEFLRKYFGIIYTKNTLYKNLPKINFLKDKIEKLAVAYARKHLSFDFTLVFFDITTLYFETFKEDGEGFRKTGFSKDNKSSQPQILVSLIVTKEGYPIAVNVFEGNKFEGHTMIPVIERFKNIHNIKDLTVVADAAMISLENIQKLSSKNLSYIVGARVSNLPLKLIHKISASIDRRERVYFQTETECGNLICDYSGKRANKNRSDRNKQVIRAQNQINNPSKFVKRLRFLKQDSYARFFLNEDLIKKDKLLEGIKGYYTNLKGTPPDLIVSRYKDLWNVEKAFRIAKSDLLARPIYHFRKQNIQAHILIVFVALCMTKSIELETNKSIKTIIEEIWDILDSELLDTLTGKSYTIRSEY